MLVFLNLKDTITISLNRKTTTETENNHVNTYS